MIPDAADTPLPELARVQAQRPRVRPSWKNSVSATRDTRPSPGASEQPVVPMILGDNGPLPVAALLPMCSEQRHDLPQEMP